MNEPHAPAAASTGGVDEARHALERAMLEDALRLVPRQYVVLSHRLQRLLVNEILHQRERAERAEHALRAAGIPIPCAPTAQAKTPRQNP